MNGKDPFCAQDMLTLTAGHFGPQTPGIPLV